jgi:hypothetical protein
MNPNTRNHNRKSTPTTPVKNTTGFYEVGVCDEIIQVPFATSQGHAIDLAIALHRDAARIPASQHMQHDFVRRIPLVIGTTVPSKSGNATLHGRKVAV